MLFTKFDADTVEIQKVDYCFSHCANSSIIKRFFFVEHIELDLCVQWGDKKIEPMNRERNLGESAPLMDEKNWEHV